jgi:heat-inducible transcriptional repressor
MPELSEREQQILERVIHYYIYTANPVGSRTISKNMEFQLSPASIRNIMSDLEEKGFISHPHTSAGRVPTDKGYRFYVNELMHAFRLTEDDQSTLLPIIEQMQSQDFEDILQESARVLSGITNQLAIVSEPRLGRGILERLELVRVSSQKLMVILSISSGLFKTIILEVHASLSTRQLEAVSEFLNSRLAGLPLHEIRATFSERVKDAVEDETGIVRLFIESSERLFQDSHDTDRLHIEGMQSLMLQPEFDNPDRLREIVGLVDNHRFILHFLNSINETDAITIKIGQEFDQEKYSDYSIIAAPYSYGSTSGTVSLIGPRRMNYPKMIAIIDYISAILSR